VAGELTAGLAESNGSLLQVYGFGHLQAECRRLGSAPEPYARFEYGTTYLYHKLNTDIHVHIHPAFIKLDYSSIVTTG